MAKFKRTSIELVENPEEAMQGAEPELKKSKRKSRINSCFLLFLAQSKDELLYQEVCS